MAPPDLKSGELVEDEKLLMRALRCVAHISSSNRSFDEFSRLCREVAASYLLRLQKRDTPTNQDP